MMTPASLSDDDDLMMIARNEDLQIRPKFEIVCFCPWNKVIIINWKAISVGVLFAGSMLHLPEPT